MFSRKMAIVVGVIVCFSISIIILSVASKKAAAPSAIGRFSIAVTSPAREFVISTIRFTQDIWRHYFYLVSTEIENDRLRKELNSSISKNNQCAEVVFANTRLRNLMGFQKKMAGQMIAAEVVGKDPSPWSKTIIIDKGVSNGVQIGQPVVIPEGIAGLVIDAAQRYAKVLLLIDPNSAVDALVQKTRARGVVKGSASGKCVFKYVLRKHNISVGDDVVSSGLDGVFPKGLRVGRVSEIVRLNAGIFQEVAVTPYADFETLEEVFIISSPPQHEFSDAS